MIGTSVSNTSHALNHVAIIMDGNGRWADSHGLIRSEGHRQGTKNLREVVKAFADEGVSFVTLYAFSKENWQRPRNEVQNLFDLLVESVAQNLEGLHQDGVCILHLGDKNNLPYEVREAIAHSEKITKGNYHVTLSLAFNYGGRAEIIEAVKKIVKDSIAFSDITERVIEDRLYTSAIPDPDLIIRTAGEKRLSNFLIWQSAYSEYYFTDVLWPDFGKADVQKAIREYKSRRRKFGALES
jgi:undecaprenyl diphosphate synthase